MRKSFLLTPIFILTFIIVGIAQTSPDDQSHLRTSSQQAEKNEQDVANKINQTDDAQVKQVGQNEQSNQKEHNEQTEQSVNISSTSISDQLKKSNRKKRPFVFKFQARGYASLQYQLGIVVQGTEQGKQVFKNENFGLAKGINAYGSLGMDWQIGNLHMQGEYSPFSYSPTSSRLLAEYNAGTTKLTYGNVNLSLQGNQFVTFSRYGRGLRLEHKFGKGNDLTLTTFETPSQVVTDVLRGNNSPGPYFLRRSPIIEGSEQVRLDETPLKRGTDYQIDYSYGQIIFGVPIPPTSVIAVSYETVGTGGGVGRFIGLRSNWRIGDKSRFGITFLTQQVPFTTQGSVSRRREEFLGDGSTGPFLLQVRPVTSGSERVFVNGLLQTREVHYRINYNEGIVTFLKPVPSGWLVVIEYEQAAGPITEIGNLRLLGLDFNTKLKTLGSLNVQFGKSMGADRNGQSAEILLGNEFQRFNYSLRWRRIGSGFVRIDNTDFFRNESGLFAEMSYKLMNDLSLSAQWQNSKSSGGRYFGIGSSDMSTLESRNRDFGLQINFERPKLPHLQINYQRLSSGFLGPRTASNNKKTSLTAHLSYRLGNLALEGALDKSNDNFEPIGHQQGSSLTASFASTMRKRLSLVFQPGSKLSVQFDWTQNKSNSTQQQYRSNAIQRVIGLSYTPWQSLQISFSVQKLNGASSISSLIGGGGLTGWAGGGFSGFGGSYYGNGFGSSGYYGTGFGGYGTFGWQGHNNTNDWSNWDRGQNGWENFSDRSRQVGISWIESSRTYYGRARQATDSSISGRASTYTTFGIQWNPIQRLVVNLGFSTNADKGSSYIANSRQRSFSFGGTYQISDKLSLFGQFDRQRISYLDDLNESLTLMGLVGINWGNPNRLNASLNYQTLRAQNLRVVGRVPQLEETTYSAIAASFQAPIAKRWTFQARAAKLSNKSPSRLFGGRYRNTEFEAQLTYNITSNLGFGVVWTVTKRSGDRPEQDYSASVLRATLSFGF